ncbi:LLM class flavin-dependent oxidoreductase [Salinibacterium sp. NSLL150]|uniref:LLM class flavin-dependent oxidoreductase n=1 Tax=unclassified Salinibacterium TaxID=2632331 RepID=UPI0018CF3BBB|nr:MULTISPECIES: LLM class flavin-dependent oxidoreductase [unclassified Salinibacterium]MBH0098657.1 LLM class flavin-dependent oxidoreductase [Salinibacterium sp. NSLL35]MBH0101412.1 LLM class flavin-dependent oxidoreductase [Salinibacterium sp. NSLL150]MBH0104171.1 LLM class flavin-dependent oxidoreductase [Salinibacterium sp. NSLL16]MBH0106932.1 LLM class flavin-dependent oxidoreductase [Salinibacterium sp. NSLL17]
MRHGIVILPQQPWAEAQHRWIHAEEMGFDHAWIYDHLSWRSLADEQWYATVPTLTAAASVTNRIGLGTFVASPNYRHPVPFAKELATLDDVSAGRFLLGVGSGGTGFDSTVLGQAELSPRERHARFEEFVRGLDELLRFEDPGSGGISFSGDWFTAVNARMVGAPAQRPRLPFVVAAEGPRGLRLTAELADGWLTLGRTADTLDEWWQIVADTSARMDDALEKAGRASGSIDRYLNLDGAPQFSLESVDTWEDAVGRADALGFTDVIGHWPRADGIYVGKESVLIEIASRFSH